MTLRNRAALAAAMLAVATFAGSAAPAGADDEPAVAMLVREALAANPDLRALEQSALAAQSVPEQARALPDPMLLVGYTNDGWSPSLGTMPDSTLFVMASQDLPWPGKRGLRAAIAERGAEQAAQQVERARLTIAASVRRAYHGLRQARMLLELVRDQGGVWTQIEGVARARYTVGQGAQQDVLRTQIEVTRVGQLEAEQRVEERIRRAELNRLLGRPPEAPIDIQMEVTPSSLTAVAPPEALAPRVDRLRAVSPALAAARAAVDSARLGVQLARRDFKPDLTLQGGYMNRGGFDPMWQAAIGINLPLARGRRRAALAQAEAELRAAEQRVQAVELQLRFRTEERLAQLDGIDRILQLYEQGVLPQSTLAVEAGIASYQSGRVPFVSVLEALGSSYADRGALVRLIASRGQVLASIEEAGLEASVGMPSMPGLMPATPLSTAPPMEGQTVRARSTQGMSSGAPMNQ